MAGEWHAPSLLKAAKNCTFGSLLTGGNLKPLTLGLRMRAGIFLSMLVTAFSGSAKADECAALVGRIVQQQHAEFTHRSPSGKIYFLRHSLAHEISVDCGDDGVASIVGIAFDNIPFPTEPMFRLTANLGSMLTGLDQGALMKTLHSCHQEALRESKVEVAERELSRGVQIECHAFIRDGGASAFYISQFALANSTQRDK